ncbi:MAG: hypothetical protein V4635_01565 [Bacteroidota bacterium]
MAKLNYTTRLANLQNRRFDKELNVAAISNAFRSSEFPDNIKYIVESMRPIDKKYNDRTIEAASRVQTHLETGFDLHFQRAYRRQGSVMTGTNIKVHSDFDLLTIVDRYHYTEGTPTNPYKESDPDQDIKDLRKQAVKILNGVYDEVDDTGEKSVSIRNKSLNRKVDVVFGFWYNSNTYETDKNEYYRGVHLFKFPNGPRKTPPDYPFAHIGQVNYKGNETNDGSKRGIRLLKTLRADCETQLDFLKSFQLTSLVHNISNELIRFIPGNELSIAQAISTHMQRLIGEPDYRRTVKSPNGMELPFFKDEIVPNLKRLKEDLDELIEDSAKELFNSATMKRAISLYQ